MLLSSGKVAYMALGSVHSANGLPQEHCWVITFERDSDDDDKDHRNATEIVYTTVRFWEPLTLQTFKVFQHLI